MKTFKQFINERLTENVNWSKTIVKRDDEGTHYEKRTDDGFILRRTIAYKTPSKWFLSKNEQFYGKAYNLEEASYMVELYRKGILQPPPTFTEGYREQFAAMGGHKLQKPKNVYMFNFIGSKNHLTQKGKIITRNAYSPVQAIRFLKRAFPELQYKNIEASEYIPPSSLNI